MTPESKVNEELKRAPEIRKRLDSVDWDTNEMWKIGEDAYHIIVELEFKRASRPITREGLERALNAATCPTQSLYNSDEIIAALRSLGVEVGDA